MTRIKCKLCKDIIWSRYRWDMQTCKCGAISIDGGNDYTKITGFPENVIFLKEKKYGNKK